MRLNCCKEDLAATDMYRIYGTVAEMRLCQLAVH